MARSMAGVGGAALALGLSVAALNAQTVSAGDLTLDFTGRVQIQLNTTSVGEDDLGPGLAGPPATAFETRRIRLGAEIAFGDWITGEVEADLSGAGARLTDGFIDLALADAIGIRAGQFKKPFGLFELESSTKIRTIERGLRIRGIEDLVAVPGETQLLMDGNGYLGRQIGIMAHGATGSLGYGLGVFNGEGANVSEAAASKAYAGRLTYGLMEPLVVGAGVSVQPTGLFDAGDEVHATALELDATWGGFRQPGLHAMAEVMVGENALLATAADPATMVGFHALAAWFAPRPGRIEGIEPVLRLSWADPDTDGADDAGLLVTPGINLYFDGRNRLMLDGELYVPGQTGVDPQYGLIAQMQIYF